MAADTDIDEWLTSQGIVDRDSRIQGMVVLAAAGLTRAGKQRIANHKLPRAEEMLWAGVTPVCSSQECVSSVASSARPSVTTTRERCSVCGGSNTRRAIKVMLDECVRSGLLRILLVGGSKASEIELRDGLASAPVEVRVVSGIDQSPTNKTAQPDLEWAQLLVVWASTQLPHSVSQAYTSQRPRSLPLVTVSRRGVEAFCAEVTRFAQGGRAGRK